MVILWASLVQIDLSHMYLMVGSPLNYNLTLGHRSAVVIQIWASSKIFDKFINY